MGRAVGTAAGSPAPAGEERARRRALELRCVLAEESDTTPGRRIGDTAPGRQVARIERDLDAALQAEPDPTERLQLREQALAAIEPLIPSPESRRVRLEAAS